MAKEPLELTEQELAEAAARTISLMVQGNPPLMCRQALLRIADEAVRRGALAVVARCGA